MRRLLPRLLVLLCLALAGGAVRAIARDTAREAAIEHELAALDPGLVSRFHDATLAFDAGKYADAEPLLAAIVARLPQWDVGLRRLGFVRFELGQRREGLELIERAIALDRSYENLMTLVSVLGLAPDSDAAGAERALALLRECEQLPRHDEFEILAARAQLAFRPGHIESARAPVAALAARYPDRMVTHYFSAILAAEDSAWNRAVHEIHAAEKLGLDHDTVQRFLDSGVRNNARIWFAIGSIAATVGLWIVGLVTLFGLGFLLSRLTLHQIDRSDVSLPVTPGEHRLRRLYRQLLNLAGLYYYVSLPVVVVLVVGVAAAIVLGTLSLGFVAIKLFLIFGIGAIVTIVSLIRSLFIKVKASDPGRPLLRPEAEGLWRLAEEVARDVGTRPVDEIRLTFGTDLCVYERGSWREKMQNRAQRILVIGTAVLDGFKQEDFRCVLAHEYGHFSNRDTAGGDIALRVQGDMIKFYYAMARAGQATWFNVAFHFLRAYHFIFRRISHGATRLQEILADRVAAQLYGPLAFEGGLRHVIRQSLEFDSRADREIRDAIKAKRPLQNFYDRTLPVGADVEPAFAKAMSRATTAEDTHPAPLDRFRLISRIPAPAHPSAPGWVWDLFQDRQAIVAEMLASVEKNIARHRT